MAKVKEFQENIREMEDTLVEIKEDIEMLFEQEEPTQLGLFDLYEKIDDLGDMLDRVVELILTQPVTEISDNQ